MHITVLFMLLVVNMFTLYLMLKCCILTEHIEKKATLFATPYSNKHKLLCTLATV